ncbi:MAG TPA: glycosyltransferase family 4 protein [Opitutales bacterium]|nr:glycosyltransferase family 4 protein [Opitutales bacterium]
MKIVHISTSDIQGGAARSAYRHHRALLKKNVDSSMLVAGKASNDSSVAQFQPEKGFRRRLARMIRKERLQHEFKKYENSRPTGLEPFNDDRSPFGNELSRHFPDADLINLHWIAGFLDYRSFLRKNRPGIPIVWTLHDMAPFTGGCHFDNSCGEFAAKCGNCPQLGSSRPNDLSRQIWMRKKAAFEKISPEQLHFVAPSRWLARVARSSSLLRKFTTTVIPYGIDTDLFSPRGNVFAMRDALEIPRSARILLFLAEYTDNRRKGFAFLDEALMRFSSEDNVFLLSIGNGTPTPKAKLPHLHLGPIANDRLLSSIYSLADVFVIPSIQDNLPNTVLEAMACGTPVVGFDSGGIRDMVENGKNGFLAPTGNTQALADALHEILPPQICQEMGDSSREKVLREFREELQAIRYTELYRKLSAKPQTDLSERNGSAEPDQLSTNAVLSK